MDVRELGLETRDGQLVRRPDVPERAVDQLASAGKAIIESVERDRASTRALSEMMRRTVEQSRAMDELARSLVVSSLPTLPHSARALDELHTMQARQASRLAAAQAERDELQRDEVELLGAQTRQLERLKDAVVEMKNDAQASSKRSAERFWAIVGLTALGIVIALAGLIR
jgi:myo-inositol-1-phosphate synthase